MNTFPRLATILGCFVFSSLFSYSQPPVQTPGFVDIPWGSSAEAVKKKFASRTRSRLDRSASTNDELQFIGGKFADLKVARFNLHFASDRFWKADLVFEPLSKDHQKEFMALKQLLVEKYGLPTSDGKHSNDLVVEWYLNGPAEVAKDKINLNSDSRGHGMKLFYAADRVAKEPAPAAKVVEASNKVKSPSVSPKARDDL